MRYLNEYLRTSHCEVIDVRASIDVVFALEVSQLLEEGEGRHGIAVLAMVDSALEKWVR